MTAADFVSFINKPTTFSRKLGSPRDAQDSALLALLLLLVLPAVVQGQFAYEFTNGTVTITGYTGPGGAVVIPSEVNGVPVTGIGNGTFQLRDNVASVTIPNSVTSIGDNAFGYCTSLTSIYFEGNEHRLGIRWCILQGV
jgi:hypothetical protein